MTSPAQPRSPVAKCHERTSLASEAPSPPAPINYFAAVEAQEAIDLYISSSVSNAGTALVRSAHLRQFDEWCTSQGLSLFDVSEVDGHRFLDFRANVQGRAVSTVVGNLYSLKAFYRWLVSRGLLDRSPFESIHRAWSPPEHKPTLTAEELRSLWTHAPSDRHRALIGLLTFGGLGVEEVSELAVTDVLFRQDGIVEIRVGTRPKSRDHVHPLLPPEVGLAVRTVAVLVACSSAKIPAMKASPSIDGSCYVWSRPPGSAPASRFE